MSQPADAAALARAAEELGPDARDDDAVQRLLAVVRVQLGMRAAWVSQFVGGHQVLRYVDAAPGAHAPEAGARLPLGGSFCARVLDGRFPAVIPDAREHPEAALLDVTAALRIGAYVGVPMVGADGVVTGMLCAIDDVARPDLSERDAASLRLLADLLHDLQARARSAARTARGQQQLRRVMQDVIGGTGRHPVLQPIVDVTRQRAVSAEGLTRFTLPSPAGSADRAPAQWFDDAGRLGLGEDLELAAASTVLDLLDDGGTVPASVSVSVNLGPATLASGRLDELLGGRDLPRTVVEITEHLPVRDYDELGAVLQPYRDDGLRVAVDDAGAGYSCLQHVLAVRPDLLKVDMALVRGADTDPARRALLSALAGFGRELGCELVAEGVETPGELKAVVDCGITLVQGYLLSRPSDRPQWQGFDGD